MSKTQKTLDKAIGEVRQFLLANIDQLRAWATENAVNTYDEYGDSAEPYLELTFSIGRDGEWAYQTGDNSFFGDCYFHDVWATFEMDAETDPIEILDSIESQWWEQIEQHETF